MLKLLLFLSLFSKPSATVKDSFEVITPDYHGYIMPLHTYPYEKYDTGAVYYVPAVKEVVQAELLLKQYLDTFCAKTGYLDSAAMNKYIEGGDIEKFDCSVIRQSFKEYFRQYTAAEKNGERYLYILCVSPGDVGPPEEMKKEWWMHWSDGGPICFHVKISLKRGVIEFIDNGWG